MARMSDIGERTLAVRDLRSGVQEGEVRTRILKYGMDVSSRVTRLRFVAYDTDGGVYLMRHDATGEELGDTWNADVAEAMEQARFEYGVVPDEWEISG